MGIAADLLKGALARSAIRAPLPSDTLKRVRFGERAPSQAKLVVRDVSKIYELNRYESIAALEKVSFSVRKNEILSLLGPSGCGKSTLLRIMAGLDRATSGEVRLDGEPILGPTRACGMVFQTYTSFPWLTVLKNVEYGLKINGIGREERRGRAEAFIDRVHLTKVKHAYPTQLSGGMKQRVAIARMLANSPEIALWTSRSARSTPRRDALCRSCSKR
jgi:NitT/TauT family transport system ATP-binding protein